MSISDYFLVCTRLQEFKISLIEQRKRGAEGFRFISHQERFKLSSKESVKDNVIDSLASVTLKKYICPPLDLRLCS